jgi:hypothetical protein
MPDETDMVGSRHRNVERHRFSVELAHCRCGPLFLTLPTALSTGQIFSASSGDG